MSLCFGFWSLSLIPAYLVSFPCLSLYFSLSRCFSLQLQSVSSLSPAQHLSNRPSLAFKPLYRAIPLPDPSSVKPIVAPVVLLSCGLNSLCASCLAWYCISFGSSMPLFHHFCFLALSLWKQSFLWFLHPPSCIWVLLYVNEKLLTFMAEGFWSTKCFSGFSPCFKSLPKNIKSFQVLRTFVCKYIEFIYACRFTKKNPQLITTERWIKYTWWFSISLFDFLSAAQSGTLRLTSWVRSWLIVTHSHLIGA